MRILSAILPLVVLLLLLADMTPSAEALTPLLRSIGDLSAELGAGWITFVKPAIAEPAKLVLRALRFGQELPAFLPLLALCLVLWFLRWRKTHRNHRSPVVIGTKLSVDGRDVPGEENPSIVTADLPRVNLMGAVPAGVAPISVALTRRHGTLAPPASAPSPFETRDPEFLPAALEILVTPASPVAIWLMTLISVTVLSGLAWSYFGWLDIHAVAPGKIQPSGRSKVVQPLETGKVVGIRVQNGSRVAAGEVLLELDATETTADREADERDLESASAEAARRKSAAGAALEGVFQPLPTNYASYIGLSVRQREEAALAADLEQLRSSLDSLKAQINEKVATKERLKASIESRARLIALSRERVEMREHLDAKGAGSRAMIIEALQQLESQVTTDVGERGQIVETDAAVVSLERKLDQTITQFVAEQTQKLIDAERKRDRLEQEVIKAKSKSDRTLLKAPIDGTVQQLAVTTIGQVVTPGQSLMTIVPIHGSIEVEAMIANKDIGFVKIGQTAVVKVDAFPFTRYGVISAEVVKISRDAVDDRDALTDAQTTVRPQQPVIPTASRTQTLVFPATLGLARRSITIDGEQVPLTPGMAVTVEIRTGERRVIDYVLSPLGEMLAQSAHER